MLTLKEMIHRIEILSVVNCISNGNGRATENKFKNVKFEKRNYFFGLFVC